MKVTKEELQKIVKQVLQERYEKPGMKTGDEPNSSPSSVPDKKEIQNKRAAMKATARGMNEETEEDVTDKKETLEEQIKTIVKEAVLKELANGNDFSAKRAIILAAQNASMDFEQEIIKGLDLVHPDQLTNPKLQERYLQVVKEMEKGVVQSVARAIKQLVAFPRNSQQPQNNNPQGQ